MHPRVMMEVEFGGGWIELLLSRDCWRKKRKLIVTIYLPSTQMMIIRLRTRSKELMLKRCIAGVVESEGVEDNGKDNVDLVAAADATDDAG